MKTHTSQAAVAARTYTNATADAFRPADDMLRALDARIDGLDEAAIAERLDRDGINEVGHEKAPHWSIQLLRAFRNPFIIVLLVLAVVQLFTDDDFTGPTIIAVMVGISVLLSFTQEFRSSRAAEKLKAMVR